MPQFLHAITPGYNTEEVIALVLCNVFYIQFTFSKNILSPRMDFVEKATIIGIDIVVNGLTSEKLFVVYRPLEAIRCFSKLVICKLNLGQ